MKCLDFISFPYWRIHGFYQVRLKYWSVPSCILKYSLFISAWLWGSSNTCPQARGLWLGSSWVLGFLFDQQVEAVVKRDFVQLQPFLEQNAIDKSSSLLGYSTWGCFEEFLLACLLVGKNCCSRVTLVLWMLHWLLIGF